MLAITTLKTESCKIVHVACDAPGSLGSQVSHVFDVGDHVSQAPADP